jgi:hypothetical protein
MNAQAQLWVLLGYYAKLGRWLWNARLPEEPHMMITRFDNRRLSAHTTSVRFCPDTSDCMMRTVVCHRVWRIV